MFIAGSLPHLFAGAEMKYFLDASTKADCVATLTSLDDKLLGRDVKVWGFFFSVLQRLTESFLSRNMCSVDGNVSRHIFIALRNVTVADVLGYIPVFGWWLQ